MLWKIDNGGISINKTDDMHSYLNPGNFYFAEDFENNTGFPSNCPLNKLFILKVYYGSWHYDPKWIYIVQEYLQYDCSRKVYKLYQQNKYYPNGNWSQYEVQYK